MRAIKKLLALLLAVLLITASVPMSVFALDSEPEVESIVANDLTIIERTNGYLTEDYDSQTNNNVAYYKYDYVPQFTVTLTDGTELEASEWGEIYYEDEFYCLDCEDDQSADNPWGVGTHIVQAGIWGYTTTFKVEIVETPVKSINIDKINIIKGSSQGSWTEGYDPETDEYEEYFKYSYSPEYTVTLKDDTVLESVGTNIQYKGESYPLFTKDDQSFTTQWDLGTHTVNAEVMGYQTTFEVELIESPIKSVEFNNITLIKDYSGDIEYEYDGETDDYNSYFRYSYTPTFTVTLKDDTTIESNGSTIEYEDVYYYLCYTDGQSYQTPWGKGTRTINAEIMGFETSFEVEIIDTPIKSIEFEKVSIVKESSGYWTEDYNPETDEYEEYYIYNYYPKYTVTLKDETVLESDEEGEIYYNGDWFYLNKEDDQSLENQWGVGTHTVNAGILGFKTTFEVEIIDTPIKSIEFEKVSIVKESSGYWTEGYNPETDEYEEYYKYSYYPQYTVTLMDETVLESDEEGGFYYNGDWFYLDKEDDQSFENQWGVGTHTVNVSILGYNTTFEVEIIDTPIKSIEFEKVSIIKGSSGYWTEDYNPETDEYEEYYKYSYYPQYTVTLMDETVLESDEEGNIYYNDDWFCLDQVDDQSSANQWGVGTHTVNVSILGYNTTFEVEIIDTPIKSIEFEKLTYIKGSNGCWEEDYNFETDEYEEYYKYSYCPQYTVTLKDETVLESDEDCDIYYNDEWHHLYSEDDQSFENQWGVGTHTVKASILGYNTTFEVEIIDTPIKSIEFEKVTLVKGSSGYWTEDYNPETDEYEEYYKYSYYPQYTVTLMDQTVLESDEDGGIYYNDEWYELYCSDDQGFENQWGIGTHTVTASILGFEATFEVEIVDTPIKNVEIEKVTLIENINGYWAVDYNSEIDEDVEYFKYRYKPQYTVTLMDETVLESDEEGGIYYNDEWYELYCEDNQSPENPWEIGTYTVNASILGFETTFEVEVIKNPNPIVGVEFEEIEIIEGTNGWLEDDYDYETDEYGEYYRYVYTPEFTATLQDGTKLESEAGAIYYGGSYIELEYYDNQGLSNPWGIGTYTVDAELLNFNTSFTVKIVETPIKSINVENIKIIKGTNFEEYEIYDPEIDDYVEYVKYIYEPKYTVTLKDGTVLKSDSWGDIEYNDRCYSLDFEDEQSYENQWGVGKHTVNAKLLGFNTTFTVQIISSPVKSIKFKNISIIEGTNCYLESDYNPETDDWDIEYYRYSYTPEYTITLKDGTALESNYGRVLYNDEWYSLNYDDDQSENPWGIGKHTVKGEVLGYRSSFGVDIIKSPYTKLEILQVTPLKESESCYIDEDGNKNYDLPNVIFRVTDKNGKSFVDSTYDNEDVSIERDTSADDWDIGKNNKFILKYINLTAKGNVEIKLGETFDYIEQDGGIYITGYRGLETETLTIPAQIAGKPVVGLISLNGEYGSYQDFKNLIIPDSVKVIGQNVFLYAYSLEKVSIGSGVEFLDAQMFINNASLSEISISGDNANYCDIDGVVYSKDKKVIVAYPIAKGKNYTIPATVENIDALNNSKYGSFNFSFESGSKIYETVGGVTYNKDKTVLVKCDPEKSGEYIMPDTVEKIADYAFSECDKLTSVKVSKNVTSIAYAAFADCYALSTVELPENLVSIEEQAFMYCDSLKSIAIPETVTTMGDDAFCGCEIKRVDITDVNKWLNIQFASWDATPMEDGARLYVNGEELTELVIPSDMTRINDYVFLGCNSIESLNISNSVTHIGRSAFDSCDSLKGVVIPDNVKSMGGSVFAACDNLESVTFGKGLTEIPAGSFWLCPLKEVYLPENIVRLCDGAFEECTKLEKVVFKNKNIEIGEGAFYSCNIKELDLPSGVKIGDYAFCQTGISELKLPNSVTEVAYNGFASCFDLGKIDIPTSVTSIGGRAFDNTKWYDSQANGAVYLEHVFYKYNGNMKPNTELKLKAGTTVIADYALEDETCLKSLVLPSGFKTIGSWALYNCKLIEKLDIPASVTSIDTSAFAGCTSLTAINVAAGNTKYKSVDGVLFTKDGKQLLWCPKRASGTYRVPSTVEKIATGAFSESGVNKLIVTNPKTELGEYSVGYSSIGHHQIWEYKDSHGNSYYSEDFGCFGGNFMHKTIEIVCSSDSKAYNYAKENVLYLTIANCISNSKLHKYTNSCDTICNVCEGTRKITHTYKNACDTTCDVCKAVRKTTHTYKTTTTKATLTKNGKMVKKCSVCDNIASTTVINYAKTFKLSATTYTYNGKVKTPTVTVKDSAGKTLKKGTDYTVTYATGRKNVGTYKVTIKMIGKYSGTKTLSFKINPPNTSVQKVVGKSKSMVVAITKKSTQVTGYQVQYALNKKFTSAKTKTLTSYKSTKTTIKSLGAKKTYYVRVRTYKTVGGVKYYSGWSAIKSVKTK